MENLVLKERLVVQKAIINENELYIPKRYRDRTKLEQTVINNAPLSLINIEISKIEEDKI